MNQVFRQNAYIVDDCSILLKGVQRRAARWEFGTVRQLSIAVEELRRRVRSGEITKSQLAKTLDIARNTLDKVFRDESVSATIQAKVMAKAGLAAAAAEEDIHYTFFSARLGSTELDQEWIEDNLVEKHFRVYRWLTTGRTLLVAHLKFSKSRLGYTFVDRVRFYEGTTNGMNLKLYEHRGIALFRKSIIYVMSPARNNIRMHYFNASALDSDNALTGIVCGHTRRTGHPYVTPCVAERMRLEPQRPTLGEFDSWSHIAPALYLERMGSNIVFDRDEWKKAIGDARNTM